MIGLERSDGWRGGKRRGMKIADGWERSEKVIMGIVEVGSVGKVVWKRGVKRFWGG